MNGRNKKSTFVYRRSCGKISKTMNCSIIFFMKWERFHPRIFMIVKKLGFSFYMFLLWMKSLTTHTSERILLPFITKKRHSSFSRWKCLNSYGLRNRTCFSQKMTWSLLIKVSIVHTCTANYSTMKNSQILNLKILIGNQANTYLFIWKV